YKLLRTALYSLRYDEADEAWTIYEKMVQCKVHKQLKPNHYGQLLNLLKFGNHRHLAHMLTLVKNMEQQHLTKHHPYPNPRHHSQILYAMARLGLVREAYDYLQHLIQKANETNKEALYPTANHFQLLASALRNSSSSSSSSSSSTHLDLHRTKGISDPALLTKFLQLSDQAYSKAAATAATTQSSTDHQTENHLYNVYVYTALIASFAQRNDMKKAQRIFDEMLISGIKPSKVTYGALINGYGRLGDLDTATKLLNQYDKRFRYPNQVILTDMLVNAIRHHDWDLAEKTNARIRKQFREYQLDSLTKTAIHWLKTKHNVEDAQHYFDSLYEQYPEQVNRIMVNMLIEGYGDKKDKRNVLEAYSLLKRFGKDGEWTRSKHHLLHALFKCRDVPAAMYTFLAMRKETIPDDITLAMVIQGLVMNHQPKVAYHLFKIIQDEGIEPNLQAYTSVFKALSRLEKKSKDAKGATHRIDAPPIPPATTTTTTILTNKDIALEASHLFQRLTGFKRPNIYIYTTLISCLAKTALMDAVRAFDDMCARQIQPTVQIYTALIQGSAIFRNSRIALMVFQHMREQNVEPNQITWHYLLKALVRSRVDKDTIDRVAAYIRKSKQQQQQQQQQQQK
ncbi:hypothetical protein BDF20DRAFT_818854, partial [Mycotypha africana]|uniref:uncharacterized protein n=1 Tax=Mycotypha africana TaxID=64632 RepID=UPI00230047E2